MAELELERLGTAGLSQQLVAETDAEHGNRSHEIAHRRHAVVEHLRIAGAIGEKHPVRLVGEHLCRRGSARQHGDPAAGADQMPRDIPLHAVVEGDNMFFAAAERRWRHHAPFPRLHQWLGRLVERLRPLGRMLRHHLADEIAPDQARSGAGHLHKFGGVEHFAGEHPCHRPADPQPPHQRPGIDAGNADDSGSGEVVAKGASGGEITGDPARLAHHEAGHLQPAALHVGGVHAVVADLRRRHRQDLAPVAGVGEDFLVAGHRGIETDLPRHGADAAERIAHVHRAVLKRKRRPCHAGNLRESPVAGGGRQPRQP